MKLERSRRPTMYFLGVSTGASSIRPVFPLWAERLDLGDVELVGVDLPLGSARGDYRRLVSFLADDPLSLGALVTTHKIDVYRSCADLFDRFDAHARSMGEVSCISKGTRGVLHGSALDPITSGLALRSFIPLTHWTNSAAEAFVIGAGGAATAITWYLTHDPAGQPARVIVSDRDAHRVENLRRFHSSDGASAVPVEYVVASSSAENDAVFGTLRQGSLVVNASGAGKDTPGSPLSDRASFPLNGFAWDLNYRGDLRFLEQARAQQDERCLAIEDGWTYFLHGWLQAIGQVFHREMPTSGPLFDDLAELAAGARA